MEIGVLRTGGLLLSICVMTFNRIATLKEAVDSILADVGHDARAEIVICDNASTDGTAEYCAGLVAAHANVRHYRSPQNGGFDGNVVNCINQAHGRFVSFFSDDDVALPGTFPRILQELERTDPAVLYLNHYSFKGSDPRKGDPWKLPARDERFDVGLQFFLFAGLGFLSALTVRTDIARKYVDTVKRGSGQAHLDVASRAALLESGPFFYLGSVAVPARVSAVWRPDWLRGCAIEATRFYQGLAFDGLLEPAIVRRRVGSSISRGLLGLVLASKCIGDGRELKTLHRRLVQTYGSYWQFWMFIAPVLVLPRALLRPPAYFIGYTANPLLFAFRGPIEAGQMGMSRSIAELVAGVGMPWVSTRSVTYGIHVNRRDYASLDRIALRSTLLGIGVAACAAVAAVVGIFLSGHSSLRWVPHLTGRILPFAGIGLLMVSTVGGIAVNSAG